MCNITREFYDENGDPLAVPTPPQCTSAWVDPNGKFFPVRDCGHAEFAEFHFGTYDLEGRGWVHVSFGNLYYRGAVRQRQLDTLFDVLMCYDEHEYKYAATMRRSYNELTRNNDNDSNW